ncbi:MAG: FkbM family methyltransferase [Cyanophyceae cyanobacterium]
MRIQVREIQFEWFNQKLKIFLYTSGDVVSTLFNPPNALNIYPYFLTKRKGYFLDIGAHIGTASVFASYLFGKVLAFEPDPRSSSILKQNTQINNIKNIEVISKAVSDYCGVSYFHIENTLNAGRSSLLKIPNSTEKIEIEVVTLDSVLEKSNLDVSYIKVDVEGIEINVLKGIEETISHQPVKPVIQLEFMPSRWHHTKNSFY